MSDARADFILRPICHGDAPRIAELIGDWEVVRWLSAVPYPYGLADAVEFISRDLQPDGPTARREAVVVDGQLAGLIGIDRRRRGMEIGYWLGRAYWRQGIMGRAAAQLTAAFFATSDETLLNSGYFSANEASAAIQLRLGFVHSGEGLLFNRAQGKRLPHVETVLTRDAFERSARATT